jgi:hypothetical protein
MSELARARQNVWHWSQRCQSLEASLDEAYREWIKAEKEIDRLEGEIEKHFSIEQKNPNDSKAPRK